MIREVIVTHKGDEPKTTTFRAGRTGGEDQFLIVTPAVSTLTVERVTGPGRARVERWGFPLADVEKWSER